jgi:integrase/recombinase XerD
MSELRQQMLADLRIRNYAVRTQEIYITRVAEMARHFDRSPELLSSEEVRDYLRELKEGRRVSRSAFAQVIGRCASGYEPQKLDMTYLWS